MKNYKHAVKSASAMKLAAVASSAIMLAPVAMNSVSSFAAGVTNAGVAYPVYKAIAVPAAGLSNTNLDGISDYLNINDQAIEDAIDALLAMNPSTPDTTSVEALIKQMNIAKKNATTALGTVVTDQESIFHQMGLEMQSKYGVKIADIQNVLAKINKLTGDQTVTLRADAKTLATETTSLNNRKSQKWMYYNAQGLSKLQAQDKIGMDKFNKTYGLLTAAQQTVVNAELQKKQQDFITAQQVKVDALAAALKKEIATFKTNSAKYNGFLDQLTKLGSEMLNATANGTVDSAARAAVSVISKMANTKERAKATTKYNAIVGAYVEATKLNVTANNSNAAAIDAAANTAVLALHKLANNKIDNDAAAQLGVATVNYNPNYGIQIWTKNGLPVRFDAKDAKAWNELHPEKQVKVGDAKKLAGQTSWKVFKNTMTAHGTTYYNLGGDQYIDANYVTVNF